MKIHDDNILDREEQEKIIHDIEILQFLWDFNYYPKLGKKDLKEMKKKVIQLKKKVKNGKSNEIFLC